jgi:Mn2+/Fe2+ NRAMP family transporter
MDTKLIANAPSGKERLKWLGPAFIWMLSSAGSGELLFTPIIASQYGYELLWAMLLSVLLKWFINREIGRYTVCTGFSVFEGFAQIKGPSNWVVWFILLPQLPIAVATIAGLLGTAAIALTLLVPVSLQILVTIILVVCVLVIVLGQYAVLEKTTTLLAILSTLIVLVAAVSTGPDMVAMASGMTFSIPKEADYEEILPWIGFLLAGSSGLMWFSFWLKAKGYGGAMTESKRKSSANYTSTDISRLKGWIKQMTLANYFAVGGALIIAVIFLILGAELLKPQQLVPKENEVAETLGKLLGELWGPTGFWIMIAIIFITFFSTLLSNIDGFQRMFTEGAQLIFPKMMKQYKFLNEKIVGNLITVFLLAILPLVIYFFSPEPVGMLKIAGALAAIQIPIVTGFILYLNLKQLPRTLRPDWISLGGTLIAGIFFTFFAFLYLWQLIG